MRSNPRFQILAGVGLVVAVGALARVGFGLASASASGSGVAGEATSRLVTPDVVRVATAAAAPRKPISPSAPPAPATPHVENVLLLTIDTLRADQPWTGYSKASTPTMSKLADESVLYTHAYSTANTTTPSLSAILSARYATELPRDNCPLAGFDLGLGLAPFLKAQGVHTFGAHGHAIFASSFAPSAGFIDWKLVHNAQGRRAVDGAVTGEEVGALISTFLREPPARFFAWAHFVDPHDAYVSHVGFPPSSDPVRGLYDGEVAYVDNVIGKVLATLAASPAAGKTAVILAADHGEAFGEHGLSRHGFTVYEEEVRVPLMVRIPGVAPARIDVPRSTIDLARTVAELMALDAPAHWRGTSLLRDLEPGGAAERPVLIDTPDLMNLPPQRAVVEGSSKVILHPTRGGAFDLGGDPRERSPRRDLAMMAQAKARFAQFETVAPRPCSRVAAGH
jgi:choline-sulfatase